MKITFGLRVRHRGVRIETQAFDIFLDASHALSLTFHGARSLLYTSGSMLPGLFSTILGIGVYAHRPSFTCDQSSLVDLILFINKSTDKNGIVAKSRKNASFFQNPYQRRNPVFFRQSREALDSNNS